MRDFTLRFYEVRTNLMDSQEKASSSDIRWHTSGCAGARASHETSTTVLWGVLDPLRQITQDLGALEARKEGP
jgi:hypothetical protein